MDCYCDKQIISLRQAVFNLYRYTDSDQKVALLIWICLLLLLALIEIEFSENIDLSTTSQIDWWKARLLIFNKIFIYNEED